MIVLDPSRSGTDPLKLLPANKKYVFLRIDSTVFCATLYHVGTPESMMGDRSMNELFLTFFVMFLLLLGLHSESPGRPRP